MFHHPPIKLFAPKTGAADVRQDFKDTVVKLGEGGFECRASQMVDEDMEFTVFLVETVRHGDGRRLVYDASDLETGERGGVDSGLTLGVVEIWK
jgi:hypothetical protein